MHDQEQHATTTAPIDPFHDPGTAPRVATPQDPLPEGFNFFETELAQGMRRRGLWVSMGPRFGFLEIRVLPLNVKEVLDKTQAAERDVRLSEGIRGENDNFSAAGHITVNRATMVAATVGMRGRINVCPAGLPKLPPTVTQLLDAATKGGITPKELDGQKVLILTGEESADAIRPLLRIMLALSIELVNQAFTAGFNLQKKSDEEVARLGEDFVHGLAGELD